MATFSRMSVLAFCCRVLPVQSDCSWTHTCGPRGCADCKDDGSAGFRQCCGGGPSPSPSGDCGWTATCGPRGCPDCKDDGSAGYRQCCGGGPGPSPSPPGPPAPSDAYCPDQGDFGSDGNVQWHGNGWTIQGGGGVHSKTTWNLNGGFVEFDMDTSGAQGGVNNNLYTTSPDQVQPRNECDIQGEGKPSCMEMDIIEMNGNCMAQSTVHTWPNHNGGCDKGGCASLMRIGGKFHVKAEFSPGGWMTVLINGQKNEQYNPSPSKQSQDYVVKTMNSHGAQIQSSQWVGWVPGGNQCPGGGNLGGSRFSVLNLVVKGSVVQGPAPKKCGQLAANSTTLVV